MPELPDLTVYRGALDARVVGRCLERIRIQSPFLLRTVEPPPVCLEGRVVTAVRLLGKRIVFGFEGERFLLLHLMVAGRLHWKDAPASPASPTPPARRTDLLVLDVPNGRLRLTEASKKKRAALHVASGRAGLAAFDRGGLDPRTCGPEAFAGALRRENHTLKRALTDPRLVSGIGNA